MRKTKMENWTHFIDPTGSEMWNHASGRRRIVGKVFPDGLTRFVVMLQARKVEPLRSYIGAHNSLERAVEFAESVVFQD